MINLLIIEENLIEAYTLTNFICEQIPYIRLYNIASTGKEAINIIKEEIVDIIILDLELSDMSGIEVIDYISKNHIEKYKNSIIIFTSEMQLLRKVYQNEYVFNYCTKTNSVNYIISIINELIVQKKEVQYYNFIKEQIKAELEMLHFKFSYTGTKYLYDIIYECFKQKKLYDINLKKEIYPVISKRYGRTINTIKSNIFQAISIMYCEIDINLLSNYLGYEIIEKPKAKDIINSVLKKIYENINKIGEINTNYMQNFEKIKNN